MTIAYLEMNIRLLAKKNKFRYAGMWVIIFKAPQVS